MKFLAILIGCGLLSQASLAGSIVDLKDWSGDERFIESVGQRGCVAETAVQTESGDSYALQVVTFPNSNGIYTNPLVIAVKESPVLQGDEFYEARAKTNASNKSFNMTLLQVGQQNQVASRYNDTEEIVRRLRADSKMTVEFASKNIVTDNVAFSLRGSSHVIKTVLAQCN